ncbi:MAG TPA: tRNA dihydrouridine synthase DusB [Tepidisphaeraceae bacterium]|nr:tRNA dihydrouridine synthase DusB [Tepidisphaeraceae bacterium]
MPSPLFQPPPPIRLGTMTLPTNLLLAPMAGYCDVSFRLIVRHGEPCGHIGLACTDLLSPEGILRENYRSMQLAASCPEDTPLCMQLYGSVTDRMCDAARWCEDRGAAVVDINMGCPVDKVTKKDGGSKLLCNPDNTLRLVEKVKGALKHTPLTCKLRLGWDDTCIVAPRLARQLEDLGAEMITIHGRTTEMRFSGDARLDGIAEVVAAVRKIPVIGNGDIRTPHDAARMMNYTRCAGIMIGRGALGRPWIFRDIWTYLTTGQIPAEPTLEQKCTLIRDHFYNLIRFRSERSAIAELRKRISWYAKTMHPCRLLKDEMREVQSPEHFDDILKRFLDWRANRDNSSAQLEEEDLAEVA